MVRKLPLLLVTLTLWSFGATPPNGLEEGKQAGDRFEIPLQEVRINPSRKMKAPPLAFRWCPPGTYSMGTDLETVKKYPNMTRYYARQETQVSVTLTKGFYIGETEISFNQWRLAILQVKMGADEGDKEKLTELVLLCHLDPGAHMREEMPCSPLSGRYR